VYKYALYDVVVKKFTFAISSPAEFLIYIYGWPGNNNAVDG